MSKTVKLNLSQFTALRRDTRTLGAIRAEAERVASKANSLAAGECSNPDHRHFTAAGPIPTGPGSIALATTGGDAGTINHNAKHNTLLKALMGGG